VQDGRSATRKLFTGTLDGFRVIYARDGLRGLYQGMSPNLVGSTFSWGLYFFLYGSVKNYMSEEGRRKLGPHNHMLAAAQAGLLENSLPPSSISPVGVAQLLSCAGTAH